MPRSSTRRCACSCTVHTSQRAATETATARPTSTTLPRRLSASTTWSSTGPRGETARGSSRGRSQEPTRRLSTTHSTGLRTGTMPSSGQDTAPSGRARGAHSRQPDQMAARLRRRRPEIDGRSSQEQTDVWLEELPDSLFATLLLTMPPFSTGQTEVRESTRAGGTVRSSSERTLRPRTPPPSYNQAQVAGLFRANVANRDWHDDKENDPDSLWVTHWGPRRGALAQARGRTRRVRRRST